MANSFRYPPQLLHSYTEPQWLPPSLGEQTSSLDRLEEQEQTQKELLKKLVLPESVQDPIGVDDSKKFALNAQQSAANAGDSDSIMMFGPTSSSSTSSTMGKNGRINVQQSFWQKYREQHASRSRSIKAEPESRSSNEETTAHCTVEPAATDSNAASAANESATAASASLHYGVRLRRYRAGDGYRARMMKVEPQTNQEEDAAFSYSMPPPLSTTPAAATSTANQAEYETAPTTHSAVAATDRSNTSSMMSFSHDDTTFDEEDDDEDMEED